MKHRYYNHQFSPSACARKRSFTLLEANSFQTMQLGFRTGSQKAVYFNGEKFTRDDRTGYFRAHDGNERTKLLHRVIYETYVGPIPKGCHVHHKDHDRSNNTVENLVVMTCHEHRMIHSAELTHDERMILRKRMLTCAIPAAAKWHKSKESHEFHVRHFQEVKGALFKKVEKKCKNCGCVFTGLTKTKFCSNRCKSAWRRKQGLDNVKLICAVCGKTFTANKYDKTKTCSSRCGVIYRTKKQPVV